MSWLSTLETPRTLVTAAMISLRSASGAVPVSVTRPLAQRILMSPSFDATRPRPERMRSLSAGFDVHLVKPVEPAELMRRLAETRA